MRATTSTPELLSRGRRKELHWSLTEPAPGSWWGVLRAAGADSFRVVARVRAGDTTAMQWTDREPPPGLVRYRLRRECLDTRYVWLSPEVRWPPRFRKPTLILLTAQPIASRLEFQVADMAPGPLDVRLYDVQGRTVVARRYVPTSDVLQVELDGGSRMDSGVYFLRVTDHEGSATQSAKLVILR